MKTILQSLMCAAVALLASCTYRFHTLNTAEVLLHRDKQVVVSVQESASVKYRYKGNDYYPIKLAYAVDKGGGVVRLACSPLTCIPDTRSRYDIRQDGIRTYMYKAKPRGAVGLHADNLIPAQDFPFGKAKKIALGKSESWGDHEVFRVSGMVCAYLPSCKTYEPVCGAVAGMPITQPEPSPAVWQRAVAVPLGVVDVAGTVVLIGTDVALGIACLPVYAVRDMVREMIKP